MKAFAALLDRLVLTPSRNGKLKLLQDYFRATPDPDRGYALAALTDNLEIGSVKPALLKELVLERMDEVLFRYSYDYVGDLAETISLVWEPPTDAKPAEGADLQLSSIIERLQRLGRNETRGVIRTLLDTLGPSERFALIKLITGGMRIGVSARLAKQALANFGEKDIGDIEGLWHGLAPPYRQLFDWLEDRTEKPVLATPAIFHSVMLSTPIEDRDLEVLDPSDFAAEWKWDGIRVQLSCSDGRNRSGDDISGAFPDIVEAARFDGVIDGELLVGGTSRSNAPVRTFSDLQQRLNRKTVTARMMEEYPVFIRAYDILFEGSQDVRDEVLPARRERLGKLVEAQEATRFDLSPLVPFSSWEELERLRSSPPDPVIEGVMLKRRDAPYLPGRPKGQWWKWKRDPHIIDAVLTPDADDLLMVARRAEALTAFITSEDGLNLLAGTKRATQLLAAEEKKGTVVADSVSADLLKLDAEKALFAAVTEATKAAAEAVSKEDFRAAMQALSALRAPVDTFFEDVLVNDEDAAIRANRLALLKAIREATGTVADFSRITG